MAVIGELNLVLVGKRRRALRHAHLGRRRDDFDAERFGHHERIFDLIVFRAVDVQVVAEDSQIDASVFDLLLHRLEGRFGG